MYIIKMKWISLHFICLWKYTEEKSIIISILIRTVSWRL